MQHTTAERRTSTRRAARGGGRRATDPSDDPVVVPDCVKCRKTGVAVVAGESEWGWWFVCLACDHLWDQREEAHGCAVPHH